MWSIVVFLQDREKFLAEINYSAGCTILLNTIRKHTYFNFSQQILFTISNYT